MHKILPACRFSATSRSSLEVCDGKDISEFRIAESLSINSHIGSGIVHRLNHLSKNFSVLLFCCGKRSISILIGRIYHDRRISRFLLVTIQSECEILEVHFFKAVIAENKNVM